jgi:hypothetical protein
MRDRCACVCCCHAVRPAALCLPPALLPLPPVLLPDPVLQSVMLVELDGPRKRTVGIQVVGQTSSTTGST